MQSKEIPFSYLMLTGAIQGALFFFYEQLRNTIVLVRVSKRGCNGYPSCPFYFGTAFENWIKQRLDLFTKK